MDPSRNLLIPLQPRGSAGAFALQWNFLDEFGAVLQDAAMEHRTFYAPQGPKPNEPDPTPDPIPDPTPDPTSDPAPSEP